MKRYGGAKAKLLYSLINNLFNIFWQRDLKANVL